MEKNILLLLCIYVSFSAAQSIVFDADALATRRAIFVEQMKPSAVAVFPSNPQSLRNLDVHYPYRQDSNFYYLSGFQEPNSIMLLHPSHPEFRYVMFIQRQMERQLIYDGSATGIRDAMDIFSADTAFYYDEFE
jgi:Xaa-Pro aminopeptidase